MKTYRTGFLLALVANIVLVAVLAGLWLHYGRAKPVAEMRLQMPTSTSEAPAVTPLPASVDTPLVPVQISAQRLQSIGVKTGEVERKLVEDEIHTTGNVVVDETKLAYVHVRFSGFIEKVFVDATYQYIRKGQPLFTIYSPDLVATEREYLVAKQNQQQVAQSTVPGVASSATSLLNAASDRLKQGGVPQQEIFRLESTGEVKRGWEFNSTSFGYMIEQNGCPRM